MSSEQPDTLRSTSYARLVDVLCEGPVEGLVDGARSIFLDETPLQNKDGTFNFSGFSWQERKGTSSQDYVPGFSATESVTAVGVKVLRATPVVRTITNTAADAALVTLGVPTLTFTDQDTGDIKASVVNLQVEVKTASGAYVNVGTTDQPADMEAVDSTTVRVPTGKVTNRADIRVAFTGVAAPVALPFRVDYRVVGSGVWLTGGTGAVVASSASTRMDDGMHDGGETGTAVYSGAATVTLSGLPADRYEFKMVPLSVVPYTPSVAGTYYTVLPLITIRGKSTSRYQRQVRVALPPGGAPWSIRVTRITDDSTSAYIQNDLYWDSLTEVVDEKLRYPFTAYVAMSIDAQQFAQIPARAYDMKLLRVQVPSNYDPLARTYTGTWNGTFVEAWTDNPAWCFYDLLTNPRYGLGAFVGSGVDKWALYQIAQYCDELVPDGTGGMEPRYTCNILLASKAEAFRVVQDMASIFRGMVYWASGSITAVQDAPRDPVALFAPANVVEGQFNYAGSSAKVRHTAALVTWNDPADLCRQKVEYVEDRAGIERYGLVMTEVAAIGCTSRSQAHRVGKWLLYSERLQTDAVQFRAGMDAATLRPGDVIKVADPGRAGVRLGGRVRTATWGQTTLDAPVTLAREAYTLAVARARANVLTYTNAFDAAVWARASSLSITPNAAIAPDGTATADELWATVNGLSSVRSMYQQVAEADNAPYTFSVYAKAGTATANGLALMLSDQTSTNNVRANFNLFTLATPTPAATGGWSDLAASITAVGGGWYRLSVSARTTTPHTHLRCSIYLGAFASVPDTTGSVYVWGAQLEAGLAATGHQQVPGATWPGDVVEAPVVQVRRNLLAWTEDMRNTADAGSSRPWSQFDDTGDTVKVTQVSTGTPLGTTALVSKLTTQSTTLLQRQASQSAGLLADNAQLCGSVYLKAAEVTNAVVYLSTKSALYPVVSINLLTGTYALSANGAAGFSGGVEDAGGGWWRVWVTANVATGTTTQSLIIGLRSATGNYQGAVGDGLLLWGAQLEFGATPTPYQSVTGATFDGATCGGTLQTIPAALSEVPAPGALWTLSSASVSTQLFQVVGIGEAEPNLYEVAAVEHDPSKFAAIENDTALQLRTFSNLTAKPGTPTNLSVAEALLGVESAPRSRLDVSWSLVDRATSYAVRWRRADGPWSAEAMVFNTSTEIPDATVGLAYTIEVAAISGLGIRCATPATTTYTVLGKAALPSDVSGFVVARVGDLLSFSWRAAPDLDIKAYEIRRGDTWETSVTVGTPTTNSFSTLGQRGGKYLIKALDTSGNYSANAAMVSVEDSTGLNVVVRREESETGWSGTYGGEVAPWIVLGGSDWAGATTWANALTWTNFNTKSGMATWATPGPHTGSYTTTALDVGAVMTSLVTLDAVVEPIGTLSAGAAIGASYEMRTSLDGATWTDWAAFTPGSYLARFFQVRVILSATVNTYRAWLTRLALIVDVPDRVENFADVAVPAEGATITYPVPFVGVTTTQVTIQSGAIGDTYRITDKTTTSVRVQLFDNTGAPKAGLIDLDVYGYGYRT